MGAFFFWPFLSSSPVRAGERVAAVLWCETNAFFCMKSGGGGTYGASLPKAGLSNRMLSLWEILSKIKVVVG